MRSGLSSHMARAVGVLLILVGSGGVVIGGFWAFMKANGAEVDFGDGPNRISGWYPSVTILLAGLAAGAVGVAVLRRSRNGQS